LSPTNELTISADGAETRRASKWLETACGQLNVPRAPAERLELCLNEVLANIIAHGGGEALAGSVRLFLDVRLGSGGGKASVTVSDAGPAFNPLTVPKKSLPKTLDDATEGGLGLVMIHRCADWLDYRHEAGRNHFTFGASWNSP